MNVCEDSCKLDWILHCDLCPELFVFSEAREGNVRAAGALASATWRANASVPFKNGQINDKTEDLSRLLPRSAKHTKIQMSTEQYCVDNNVLVHKMCVYMYMLKNIIYNIVNNMVTDILCELSELIMKIVRRQHASYVSTFFVYGHIFHKIW